MLTVLLLVVAGTYVALTQYGSAVRSGRCTASGLDTTHRYSSEQTANAALISAVAVDRGLPPRAASIALATAFQESRLENIDYGDRDSLGLFQQRPSQGWGSEEEIMDPIHSSNAFYDKLEEIDYQDMSVNDAAQTVQRSGFPEAYGDHETEGRIFASALTGHSGANLVCDLEETEGVASPQGVKDALEEQFPRLTEAGTITSTLGTATLTIDPHGEESRGWALANWGVARAAEDGVVRVSYGGRTWDREATGQEPGAWGKADADADPDMVLVEVAGG
jgi:hypothetical protein